MIPALPLVDATGITVGGGAAVVVVCAAIAEASASDSLT